MSRIGTIVSVLVGVALLVGVPLVWAASQGPDRVGSLSVAAPTPDATETATAATTPTTPAAPRATPSPTSVPTTRPDPLAAVRPPEVARPAQVRIPALGVDATVVEVGVEDDGGMEIPEDVATVGWYRWGPTPGGEGSAVIAGHVDSRTQGRGAFFDLRRLDVGDVIEVTYDDGSTTSFVVQGRDTVDKEVIPLDDVFQRDGAPRLTLITCGGEFDYGTRHYESNVVVVATPIDA